MKISEPATQSIGPVKAIVGESTVWDAARKALLWVDIRGRSVMETAPLTGATVVTDVGEMIGGVVPSATGSVLAAQETGLFALDFVTGTRTFVSAPITLRPDQRFNDLVVDPAGRLIVGTMRTQRETLAPDGVLYRYAHGTWETLFTGFWTINGLAFSPDGATLYLSDSHPAVQTIWACDYDARTGAVGERRVFATMQALDGRPDGAAVDADGGYWIAAVGGGCLYRFTPDGTVDRRVALPVENPTKPAFGGAALDRLFVTSMSVNLTRGYPADMAGRLIALDVGCTGVALPPFAG